MPFWSFWKSKPDYEKILGKYLDRDFLVVPAGKDAPTKNDVADFEVEFGFKLPEEFAEYSVSTWGGMYIEVKESVWPRAKEYDVGPFWSFLYGIITYGLSPAAPEFLSLRLATREFQSRTGLDYVPFLKLVGDPSIYCFDLDGKSRRFDSSTGECPIVDGTFSSIFEQEVAALKDRKVRKVRGEDKSGSVKS